MYVVVRSGGDPATFVVFSLDPGRDFGTPTVWRLLVLSAFSFGEHGHKFLRHVRDGEAWAAEPRWPSWLSARQLRNATAAYTNAKSVLLGRLGASIVLFKDNLLRAASIRQDLGFELNLDEPRRSAGWGAGAEINLDEVRFPTSVPSAMQLRIGELRIAGYKDPLERWLREEHVRELLREVILEHNRIAHESEKRRREHAAGDDYERDPDEHDYEAPDAEVMEMADHNRLLRLYRLPGPRPPREEHDEPVWSCRDTPWLGPREGPA